MRANLLLGSVWAVPLMLWASGAFGQGVLVFGAGNSTSPAGAQANAGAAGYCNGCVQPRVYGAQPVRYRTPDIIYVGAARGYPQPNYFSGYGYGPVWANTWAPNVIPFGLGQAYVHGYLFRHAR